MLTDGLLTMRQVEKICKQYYDEATYDHAQRVADYVLESGLVPITMWEDCIKLALMHDLIEDTDYKGEDLPPRFKEALMLLTKPKGMKYVDYCKQLKPYRGYATAVQLAAYYVKLADMKDHLAQKETLTDRLKQKYLEGLAELL